MEWLEIIKFIGSIFVGSSVIAVLIAYLFKVLLKQYLDKDLEKYKSDLEKETLEHHTKFERLHTERAEVVKNTYQRLVRARDVFEQCMKPMRMANEPSEEEDAKEAVEQFNKFIRYYEENKIYFEKDIAKDLDKIRDELKMIWLEFNKFDYSDLDKPIRNVEKWNNAWEKLKEQFPRSKEKLEERFRLILGLQD